MAGVFVICLLVGAAIWAGTVLPDSKKSATAGSGPVHPLIYKPMEIVGLGDSITWGRGDEYGEGYIRILARDITRATARPVTISNLAIPGHKSGQMLKQLHNRKAMEKIKQADLIVLTIGTNDLYDHGLTYRHYSGEKVKQDERVYLENIHKLYDLIRSVNSDVPIYQFGIYNSLSQTNPKYHLFEELVTKWNSDLMEVTAEYERVAYVDSQKIIAENRPMLLADDHFHPNHRGHYRMAAKMFQTITSSLPSLR